MPKDKCCFGLALRRAALGEQKERDRHVTITIEADDWLPEVRRCARPTVIDAGWSDNDIDRRIKQARKEVEPGLR
ncbi:MAG: hypothetical protein ACREE4_22710 [Stellaceae bacterium]